MKSRITLVLALLIILAVTVASAGCGKKNQPAPQGNEPKPIDFNEVTEVFPAGELNRQVDGDIREALQDVFGDVKLATIFALQNGQVVEDVDTPGAGRHLVYVVPRAASEADAAAIVSKLEALETVPSATSGTSGMMRTISYAREVEGELYRVSIGYRPGDQQIGISVYPMGAGMGMPGAGTNEQGEGAEQEEPAEEDAESEEGEATNN